MGTGTSATNARGNHPHLDAKLGKESAKSRAETLRRARSNRNCFMGDGDPPPLKPSSDVLTVVMLSSERPRDLLELFPGAEDGHAVSTHRHDVSGLWIPGALSAFPGSDLKRAKTPQLDYLVLIKSGLYLFEELVNDVVNVFSIDAELFVDAFDDLCFGQFASCQNGPSICAEAGYSELFSDRALKRL